MQGLVKRQYLPQEASALEQQWLEQIRTGTFSEGVTGVGTLKFMKNTGDTPAQYPVLQSLSAAGLSRLTEAERYALQMVDEAVQSVQQGDQALFAVAPGLRPGPESRLEEFDPTKEYIYAVPRVVGG